jgi:hypothetical protein
MQCLKRSEKAQLHTTIQSCTQDKSLARTESESLRVALLLTASCPAQDLVGQHLDYAADSKKMSSKDLGILLLGDSGDRNLIFDFCQTAGHQVLRPCPLTLLVSTDCAASLHTKMLTRWLT